MSARLISKGSCEWQSELAFFICFAAHWAWFSAAGGDGDDTHMSGMGMHVGVGVDNNRRLLGVAQALFDPWWRPYTPRQEYDSVWFSFLQRYLLMHNTKWLTPVWVKKIVFCPLHACRPLNMQVLNIQTLMPY